MRVIIAGGRDYHLGREDWEKLIELRDSGVITEVVSGGCRGVDFAGERWAELNGLMMTRFPAEWDVYRAAAGPIRNRKMAEYADAVILFRGGRGTDSMRKIAKEVGLKVLYDWGERSAGTE